MRHVKLIVSLPVGIEHTRENGLQRAGSDATPDEEPPRPRGVPFLSLTGSVLAWASPSGGSVRHVSLLVEG